MIPGEHGTIDPFSVLPVSGWMVYGVCEQHELVTE